MNYKFSFLIVISILLNTVCQAQDLNNKVLLSIEGRVIESGEFIRMYNKSVVSGKTEDIGNYLDDFIIFKLKVTDALNEGYDTTKAFRNELNGYRNQLSQNYLTDKQTKEELLQKTYKRYLTEINAWHILVALPEAATPEDTLKAWDKACDIRERILKGESFEQVARGTSDDQSVKVNGGNLGYFSVFQMIMPFEDAAYNLKPGSLSMPVRTPYGYHIIKVTDRRPSKGKVKVAHIMKNAAPGTDENEQKKAEADINDIYRQLENGSSFVELAKKYSDHKESAPKGGELNWFGSGEIISDFSEAAFAIKDTGSYTKPVRTIYGWHIIKLLDRKEPGTFEESRAYLESKISQSYINSISRQLFVQKLKKEYNFKLDQAQFNWFVENTDTLIIRGLKNYDLKSTPDNILYSFADQKTTSKEFAKYIEKRGPVVLTQDPLEFINRSFDAKVSEHIISYENSILEEKYPEFRYLMNEFHDGILLFEISAKKIWNRVSEDTIGLEQYYEKNKSQYLTPLSIDATIYSLKVADGEKALLKSYRKFSGKKDKDSRLLAKFNKNDALLTIKDGIWSKGDDPDIDNISWKKGYRSFVRDGFPSILLINSVIDPAPLPFKDIQGEMMTGYQEYLEKIWIEQLKEKYSVKIDSLVLEGVKKKLNNE